jgi:hypothetical protein
MSIAKFCPYTREFCKFERYSGKPNLKKCGKCSWSVKAPEPPKMEEVVEDYNPPKDIAKYLIERLEKAGILPKIVLPEGSDEHIDEIIEQTIDLIDRY